MTSSFLKTARMSPRPIAQRTRLRPIARRKTHRWVKPSLKTAAKTLTFSPARPAGEKVRVFAAVFKDGFTHLWVFLRAIGLSLVLWAIGLGLIRAVFKKLDVMAYQSG